CSNRSRASGARSACGPVASATAARGPGSTTRAGARSRVVGGNVTRRSLARSRGGTEWEPFLIRYRPSLLNHLYPGLAVIFSAWHSIGEPWTNASGSELL